MGSRPHTEQWCFFAISSPLAQTYKAVRVLCWWKPGANGRFQQRWEDEKGILKHAGKSTWEHSDSSTLAETGGSNTASRASSQVLHSSLDALTSMLLSGLGSSGNNMCLSSSCCFSVPPLNTKPASQLQEPRAGWRQMGGKSVQVTEGREEGMSLPAVSHPGPLAGLPPLTFSC